jgi:hypothetical protein
MKRSSIFEAGSARLFYVSMGRSYRDQRDTVPVAEHCLLVPTAASNEQNAARGGAQLGFDDYVDADLFNIIVPGTTFQPSILSSGLLPS